MGNQESSPSDEPATVSDYAKTNASEDNKNTLAQSVVNDMSSVVAQQELYIQKLTSENTRLQSELDAAERRKAQYKAKCKANNLL